MADRSDLAEMRSLSIRDGRSRQGFRLGLYLEFFTMFDDRCLLAYPTIIDIICLVYHDLENGLYQEGHSNSVFAIQHLALYSQQFALPLDTYPLQHGTESSHVPMLAGLPNKDMQMERGR